MVVLQCEICGGRLIGKPGGVFECDSCGMEYSTEWAKAKVQEIKGTVKIEGPVEVTGTVKVEGGASVESLLKRGKMVLSDGYCDKAQKIFEQILNLDSECAEAYLGLAMSIHQVATLSDLEDEYIENPGSYDKDKNFQCAQKFAGAELKATLNKIKKARQTHEQQESRRKQGMIPAYAKRREQLRQAANMISAGQEHIAVLKLNGTAAVVKLQEEQGASLRSTSYVHMIPGWRDIVAVSAGGYFTVGLKANGTVLIVGTISNPIGENDLCGNVLDWQGIVAVSAGCDHIVGLRADATVVATGNNEYGQCDTQGWSDIAAVAAGKDHTVGLKSNGTVIAVGNNNLEQCNVQNWSDIVMIGAGDSYSVALRADGTVVTAGSVPGSLLDSDDSSPDWADIVSISAGHSIMGLKLDGTVKVAGSDSWGQCSLRDWDDVVAITAGGKFTAVLRRNGEIWRTKISFSGRNSGDTFVGGLKLFKDFETLEQEQTQMQALDTQRITLQTELANLKGLFSGGKRRELEAKLAQVEKEMNTL